MVYKPVTISNRAFYFCRYGVATMLWLSWLTGWYWLVWIVSIIFALSWLLKITKAPMIVIYTRILSSWFGRGKNILVDQNSIRFAHAVGAIMSGLVIVSLWLNPLLGRALLFGFCLLKTVSALGFCPAGGLYTCVRSGGCCSLSKKWSHS